MEIGKPLSIEELHRREEIMSWIQRAPKVTQKQMNKKVAQNVLKAKVGRDVAKAFPPPKTKRGKTK